MITYICDVCQKTSNNKEEYQEYQNKTLLCNDCEKRKNLHLEFAKQKYDEQIEQIMKKYKLKEEQQ